MPEAGVEQNMMTYNTVIAACVRAEHPAEALEVFRQMKEKQVNQDQVSHRTHTASLASDESYLFFQDLFAMFVALVRVSERWEQLALASFPIPCDFLTKFLSREFDSTTVSALTDGGVCTLSRLVGEPSLYMVGSAFFVLQGLIEDVRHTKFSCSRAYTLAVGHSFLPVCNSSLSSQTCLVFLSTRTRGRCMRVCS